MPADAAEQAASAEALAFVFPVVVASRDVENWIDRVFSSGCA
jgi:putative NADPH-quinone reductase